jgi:hypothetical protein
MNKIPVSALLLICCLQLVPAQGSKPTLLVLDVAPNNVEESKCKIVQSYIFDQIHRTGGYVLVERSQLEDAFEEMQLTLSGAVDDSTAVEIGKITGAEYILLSSLSLSDGKYYISMRVVSVSTTKITNTSVKSTKSFSNIEKLVGDTVSSLLGAGLEEKDSEQYITLNVGSGPGFPLDPISDVLGLAVLVKADLAYDFGFPWGSLSCGLSIGSIFTATQKDTFVEYKLYSVMALGSLGYKTNFDSPFYLSLIVNPGAAFSFLVYPESETGGEAKVFSTISFSLLSELGAGFSFTESCSLLVFGDFVYTMFSGDDYMAVFPGIGLALKL